MEALAPGYPQEDEGTVGRSQTRYKKNYDACLRTQSEVIHKDYYVYIIVDRSNRNEHSHKLSPRSKGKYKTTKVDTKTVFL